MPSLALLTSKHSTGLAQAPLSLSGLSLPSAPTLAQLEDPQHLLERKLRVPSKKWSNESDGSSWSPAPYGERQEAEVASLARGGICRDAQRLPGRLRLVVVGLSLCSARPREKEARMRGGR